MIDNLVSIITPAYNAASTISETIMSVLNQTYDNWEMIIVDDCSTDDTIKVVKTFTDKRIKLLHNEVNLGPAMSWNRAFEVMQGRWVAFLDADDLWTPTKLQDQLQFMITNGYEYTFTSYDWIDSKGKPLGKIIKAKPDYGYYDSLKKPLIGNSTVILDRKVIKIPMLPNVRYNNDACLRVPISKAGHIAHGLSDIYMHYRIMPKSVSRNKFRAAKNYWTILREIHHLPFIKRCYYFSYYALNSIKKYYID